ncbi:unnamed protein product [Triticum turgidum subsp. durum]|uniref:J domain-containing protein n=1 Tax=Triticum turgidum subsp. durum TaxID=4567 RepID=A0A9R1Q3L5_TRITD|nr:unnamed protein product [Triticum turgidum subsp. durum]
MQAAASWGKGLPGLRSHLCAAASFHSTPPSPAKWKGKFDCKHEHGERKLSKKYERYVVRQKRAEGKKALQNYLLYGKSTPHIEDGSMGSFANSHDIPRFKTFRKKQDHSSTKPRQGVHHQRKDKKDKAKFYNFFYETRYVNPESESEDESDDDDTGETAGVGSHAHRVTLGLPPRGPLTLDDVKTAFRASALRWHPDKHPGSSQAVAEEKFKLCVNAYNSLCAVLKAA